MYNNYSMRALTSFLLCISLLCLFICDETKTENKTSSLDNKTEESPKEESEEEINARKLREDIKKALSDLGASDAETITKEQFGKVFKQVMDKGDDAQKAEVGRDGYHLRKNDALSSRRSSCRHNRKLLQS